MSFKKRNQRNNVTTAYDPHSQVKILKGVVSLNGLTGKPTLSGSGIGIIPSGDILILSGTTINARSGSVTFTAGPNITINTVGNNISITGSGGATAAAGSQGQVQYNEGGVLGGAEVYYSAVTDWVGMNVNPPSGTLHIHSASANEVWITANTGSYAFINFTTNHKGGNVGAWFGYDESVDILQLGSTVGGASRALFTHDVGTKATAFLNNSINNQSVLYDFRDSGFASDTILRIAADDANPYALIVGNNTYSTVAWHGIAMYTANTGYGSIDMNNGGAKSHLILQESGVATGYVGIGTNGSPFTKLHVQSGSSGASNPGGVATIESDTFTYLHLLTPNASGGGFVVGTPENNFEFELGYNANSQQSYIYQATAARYLARMSSSGQWSFGVSAIDTDVGYHFRDSGMAGSTLVRIAPDDGAWWALGISNDTYSTAHDGGMMLWQANGGNGIITAWNAGAFGNIILNDDGSGNNVGIGIAAAAVPEGRLHVASGSAGTVTGYGGATLTLESSLWTYQGMLHVDTGGGGIYWGSPADEWHSEFNWHNGASQKWFGFWHSGSYKMVIKGDTGNTAIGQGLTSPEATLHIYSGSAGSVATNNDATSNVVMVIEHSKFPYVQFQSPKANGGGFIWGNPSSNFEQEFSYDSSIETVYFWKNGLGYQLAMSSSGVTGIGILTPDTRLHVHEASAGSVTAHGNAIVTIERNTHAFINFLTPNASAAGLYFGDPDDNTAGEFYYHNASSTFYWYSDSNNLIQLSGSGEMFFPIDVKPNSAHLVGVNSHLILSSSAGSYVTVSGSLLVTDPASLISRGVIYNDKGHLILSSSVGSTIHVSGSLEVEENLTVVGLLTASSPILFPDGSESNPSITFLSDPDTGFYRSSTDEISITTGGSQKWQISSLGVLFGVGGSTRVKPGGGTVGSPALGFYNDNDTGFYNPTADVIAAVAGGTESIRIAVSGSNITNPNSHLILSSSVGSVVAISSSLVVKDAGSSTAPSLSLVDGDTGFYEPSADQIGIVTGGVRRFNVFGGEFRANTTGGASIRNVDSDGITPNIHSDYADTDTGIGHDGPNTLSLVAGGVQVLTVSGSSVGIGATIPSGSLHVHTTTANNVWITANTGSSAFVNFGTSKTTHSAWVGYDETADIVQLGSTVAGTARSFFTHDVGTKSTDFLGNSISNQNVLYHFLDNGHAPNTMVRIAGDDQAPWALGIANNAFSTDEQAGLMFYFATAGYGAISAYGAGATGNKDLVLQEGVGGKTGIGTNSPSALVHIYSGSSGGTPTANSVLIVENDAAAYIQMLTPTTAERGILFGDNASSADGGVIYTSGNSLLFRTNGNNTRAHINSTGEFSMGPADLLTPERLNISGSVALVGVTSKIYSLSEHLVLSSSAGSVVAVSGALRVLDGSATAPSISYLTDPTLGFYRDSANVLGFTSNAAARLSFGTSGMDGAGATAPRFANVNASATTPNIIPNKTDTNTGIGSAEADVVSVIAGGSESIHVELARTIFNTNVILTGNLDVGVASEDINRKITIHGSGTANYNTSLHQSASTFYIGGGVANQTFVLGRRDDAQSVYTRMYFDTIDNSNLGRWYFRVKDVVKLNINATGSIYPETDNDALLGLATNRWKEIHAANAYITDAVYFTGALHFPTDAAASSGHIIADTSHLVLSSSAGSYITVSGSLVVSDAGTAAAPSVAFGFAADTGFYEKTPNVLGVTIGGSEKWSFLSDYFRAANSNGAALESATATNTNPTILPNYVDNDTGIGQNAANQISLIAGGIEAVRIDSAGQMIGPTQHLVLSSTAGSIVAISGTGYITEKLGIGTNAVPHGGIGAAKLAIEGTVSSVAEGPHIQYTVTTDNYPVFQQLNYAHDNVAMSFDAYYDGSSWKSSDPGSNFQIYKLTDTLSFRYDSGITAGSTLAWNTGFSLSNAGTFTHGGTVVYSDGISHAKSPVVALAVIGSGSLTGSVTLSGDPNISITVDNATNEIIFSGAANPTVSSAGGQAFDIAPTTVGTTGVIVDSINIDSVRAVKYIASCYDSAGGPRWQTQEMLLMHSSGALTPEAGLTQYSIVTLPDQNPFVGFEATLTGTTLNLIASGTNITPPGTVIKIAKFTILA